MPLIDCPECHRQISDRAPACPGCGHPGAHVAGPASAAKPFYESGANEGRHAGTIKAGIAGLTVSSLGGWVAKAVAVVVFGIVAIVAVVAGR